MYIADLHIHSKYSRATSRDCNTAHLDFWARRKGIQLLGTGDFTHSGLASRTGRKADSCRRRAVSPAGRCTSAGFFLPDSSRTAVCSVRGNQLHLQKRRPNPQGSQCNSAARLWRMPKPSPTGWKPIGNIHSDGRPILGLDSRDLLEITLDACPQAVFIPAHIWTPHFSMFGAFSGFDTVEECFGDLTPHIHAVETGLSSDPPMNWRVSALDGFTLVSNSDAHSPAKLGPGGQSVGHGPLLPSAGAEPFEPAKALPER